MQVAGVEILWAVVGGSAILLILAIGYVVVLVQSHRRVMQAQQAKLEEVRTSEEKFRGIFDNSLAGIMKFSVDTWAISDANEAIMDLCGCSSLEDLQSCMSKLPRSSLESIHDSVTKYGFIAEYEIRTTRKDGGELWMLFSAKKMENGPSAQAVVVDITKRKQFEEKIKEQRALLDQTQDAIMVVDYDGTVTFWNAGAEMMYGWSRDEMTGRVLEELLYGGARRKDFQEAMEDIHRFKEWNGEHYHTRKDGKEILVESRWRTVAKAFNGKLQILIVNSDITEKKRLESQFIRAQKMESVALLTGGMAHDLQNILAPIAMSIHLLEPKVHDEPGLAILKAVGESAQSGLDLVRSVADPPKFPGEEYSYVRQGNSGGASSGQCHPCGRSSVEPRGARAAGIGASRAKVVRPNAVRSRRCESTETSVPQPVRQRTGRHAGGRRLDRRYC